MKNEKEIESVLLGKRKGSFVSVFQVEYSLCRENFMKTRIFFGAKSPWVQIDERKEEREVGPVAPWQKVQGKHWRLCTAGFQSPALRQLQSVSKCLEKRWDGKKMTSSWGYSGAFDL